MTFVELAHAIDTATSELANTKLAVEAAELKHKALLEAHRVEQETHEAAIYEAKFISQTAENKVRGLITEMKAMMGIAASEPKVQPTTSELKQLFLDGQKLRGK